MALDFPMQDHHVLCCSTVVLRALGGWLGDALSTAYIHSRSMDGVCFVSVSSCEYQVYRPAFSSLEAFGLFYTPVLFHCRAMCIIWSAGKRFIFLPTYAARALMVSGWRISAM